MAINCACVPVRSQIYNCPIDSPEENQPPSHWEATAVEPELTAGHTFKPLRDCISFTKIQKLSLSKDGLYVNRAEQAICIPTKKEPRHAARSSTVALSWFQASNRHEIGSFLQIFGLHVNMSSSETGIVCLIKLNTNKQLKLISCNIQVLSLNWSNKLLYKVSIWDQQNQFNNTFIRELGRS